MMLTLSNLPGRIKFALEDLRNNIALKESLEGELSQMKGIIYIEANHRTGRLLIIFKEAEIETEILKKKTREIIMKNHRQNFCQSSILRKRGSYFNFSPKIFEIAAKYLLPKPFDMLVPVFLNNLKKD